MGVVETITHENFPKQGDWLGKDVTVCYHYDTTRTHKGKIVRDDLEHPYETIIQLEGNKFIRSQECQWRPILEEEGGQDNRATVATST